MGTTSHPSNEDVWKPGGKTRGTLPKKDGAHQNAAHALLMAQVMVGKPSTLRMALRSTRHHLSTPRPNALELLLEETSIIPSAMSLATFCSAITLMV